MSSLPTVIRAVSFLLIIILITLISPSCEENIIEIPKYCTDAPDLNFNNAELLLYTDVTSVRIISAVSDGRFQGDSIAVKSGDYFKLASIEGQICKDLTTTIYVRYMDTTDNSRLKIEARDSLSQIAGKIFYCPEVNNCTYTQIGRVIGYITEQYNGFFYSPLVSGYYRINPYYFSNK
jgi:hypothetical protein